MTLIEGNSKIQTKNNNIDMNHENFFPKFDLDGITFKTIISGDKTGNEYSIIEILFPEGDNEKEIPLHIQSQEIVIVCVVHGDFEIVYGKQNIKGIEGTVLKLEKDIPRSFKKKGNSYGKLLVTYIPAGFENFFREIASCNIEDLKRNGIEDPILIQLLEKNYGAKVLFEEP